MNNPDMLNLLSLIFFFQVIIYLASLTKVWFHIIMLMIIFEFLSILLFSLVALIMSNFSNLLIFVLIVVMVSEASLAMSLLTLITRSFGDSNQFI